MLKEEGIVSDGAFVGSVVVSEECGVVGSGERKGTVVDCLVSGEW